MEISAQRLPRAGPARETLREKGQFWTPDWVAQAMVAYVLGHGSDTFFDPAVGAGAFFRAAKKLAQEQNREIALSGCEMDPGAIAQAAQTGLSPQDLSRVQTRDFVLDPPRGPFKAIAANPPYIRHHRLSGQLKAGLRKFGATLIGKPLDGRAGIHIYFLLRSLELLDRDGRLAFIMPADTCEGVFANTLWRWVTRNYCLEAVINFTAEASPFPGVDTNALIFMIRKTEPRDHFTCISCHESGTQALKTFVLSGFKTHPINGISARARDLSEALDTGLSRRPVERTYREIFTLGDYARVMRGIATGANEFFFLTRQKCTELQLPDEFLFPAIGRTRDADGSEITHTTIRRLEFAGRPTWLFSPDSRPIDQFPASVRQYIEHGEQVGLPKRALIATRRPWYKMEVRSIPPILFAYLGRRNVRFIRNRAGVLPLTGFLCVYPHEDSADFVEKLCVILKHPETLANLSLVGKSYGGGGNKGRTPST